MHSVETISFQEQSSLRRVTHGRNPPMTVGTSVCGGDYLDYQLIQKESAHCGQHHPYAGSLEMYKKATYAGACE